MEMPDLSSQMPKSVQFSPGLYPEDIYRLIPVFYPYYGCEKRCVFCAQSIQTGMAEVAADDLLKQLDQVLDRVSTCTAAEIAFYGGTFTLWPRVTQRACLERVAQRCAAIGAWRVRCSTRPASFGPGRAEPLELAWLSGLRSMGLHLVEVGVQSFNDAALRLSGRDYTGSAASKGCESVKAAGVKLGIQLMPGMPGVNPEVFLDDVRRAIDLGADCLRLYPCLVFEGTGLADLWRQGRYVPWGVETTVQAMAEGLSLCWRAGIPVIRMGLAPGPALRDALLAGPWHDAMGNLVQTESLALTLEREIGNRQVAALHVPLRCQGFLGGRQGRLAARLRQWGISTENIFWHEQSYISIIFA